MLVREIVTMMIVFGALYLAFVVSAFFSVDGFISKGSKPRRGTSATARNMFSGIVEVEQRGSS